jgi:hypothetical protein
MECLKRFCGLTRFIDPNEGERLSLFNYPNKIHNYLLQRKTQLSIFVFLALANGIYGLVQEIISFKDVETYSFAYYLSVVNIILCTLFLVSSFLLLLARYFWNSFKISCFLVFASYFIRIFAILILFFIPYDFDFVVNALISLILLVYLFNTLQPLIFVIHNIITVSNNFYLMFKNKDFRLLSILFCAFYLPLLYLACGAIFQTENIVLQDINHYLYILPILYTLILMTPFLTNNKYTFIFVYILYIPFLILLYICLKEFDIDILTIYIQGYINNLFVNIFVCDLIVYFSGLYLTASVEESNEGFSRLNEHIEMQEVK